MQTARVERLLGRASRASQAQELATCLSTARRLRAEILGEVTPDPVALGWARFYEIKSLYELGEFAAAWERFSSGEKQSYVMSATNAAFISSVASELAMHMNLPDEVVRLGRQCLDLRLAAQDYTGVAQCYRTMETLLSRLGRPDLFAAFAAGPSEELLDAAARGDFAAVSRALGGVQVDARDRRGRSALLLAAFAGHTAIVRLLLEHGADVRAENVQRRTALVLAADQGHSEIVKLLLAHGADANHAGLHQQTALHVAGWQGHAETVRVLLAHGADPQRFDVTGHTPMTLAATADQPEVIEAFLAGGARVDAPTPAGHTALMNAAMEGRKRVVRVLLEAGADPRLTDRHGMTALDWARQEGFAQIAAGLEAVLRLQRR